MTALKLVGLFTFVLILDAFTTLAFWPVTVTDDRDSSIPASNARAAAAEGILIIVDVCSPWEWREAGVADGARMATIYNRNGTKGFVADMVKAVGGHKSEPVALIYATEARSDCALKILMAAGSTTTRNVSEGMFSRPAAGTGWLKLGLPVTQAELLSQQSGVLR